MQIKINKIIISILLFTIILGQFIFLITVSPYPVGDDPGKHTAVLKYIINNESVKFNLPFFPQLKTSFVGNRFVTSVFLAVVSKITNFTDVFILTIWFAAFCSSFSLFFIYSLIKDWLKSPGLGLLAIAILAFGKWYQENFWEGSYDQYTGLLFFSALIYYLFSWYQTKKIAYFFISLFFIPILYVTHQLGFIIGFIIFSLVVFEMAKQKIKPIIYYPSLLIYFIALIAYYLIAKPGYFAVVSTGNTIPNLLSNKEGTHILMYFLCLIGFTLFIFFKRNNFIFIWFSVVFIFAQSFIFNLPFYSYRFNLYLIQIIVVFLCLPLYYLFQFISHYKINKVIIPLSLSIIFVLFFSKEFSNINSLAHWVTSPSNNPASVILQEDINAFMWLKENTKKSDVILATYKWGNYIPAIAERGVILDNAIGGDERDNRHALASKGQQVFKAKSAEEAQQLAEEIKVQYIFWDASIARFPERYEGYHIKIFNDQAKFNKVYESKDVKIFQVL